MSEQELSNRLLRAEEGWTSARNCWDDTVERLAEARQLLERCCEMRMDLPDPAAGSLLRHEIAEWFRSVDAD